MNKKIGVFIAAAFMAFQVKSQVIITGVMIDPVGKDQGYEYIQMMATEDIDFSTTPYSLVRSMNTGTMGSVTANGWATGGIRTFKFDLTKGKAAKGTFFYVGGEKKRIAGYLNGVQSTDISAKAENPENRANWIRTIKYAGEADGTVVGDGFGEKTNGLIPNGKSNPVGLAVFKGTEVTGTSVPVDVIFLATASPISNTAILGAFNVAQGIGYLVCDNDLYSIKKTKYFADGANMSAILYQNAKGVSLPDDVGNFLMLGGVYNSTKKRWDKARITNYVRLVADKEDTSSITKAQLTDIEKASGVTTLK